MLDITYKDILSTPQKFVPLLSEKDTKVIMIETILEYIENKIDLKTLVTVANSIKQFTNVPLAKDIQNTIDEINSMHVIDDVLVDILEELIEK